VLPINLLVRSFKDNLSTKVKLLVGFYQISTLLHSSYNVPYPYSYLNVMEKLQFISVDFTKALPGPCIFGPGYGFTSKLYTMGSLAVVIYAGSWKLVKFSAGESPESPRPWAKKAVSWLPTVLFLVYPGFSAFFFDALKCQTISTTRYLVAADLSMKCEGGHYNWLRVFSIVFVVLWDFGLPAMAIFLLWPERGNLLQGQKPRGFREHLIDFYTPYKPQFWFFESVEYGRKLLLVGVVPAISGDLIGAVIALLITVAHLLLLTAVCPYAHKSDQFVAVCSNTLLFIVILLSVLLKMDAAYIAKEAADGIDPGTASVLLVASNALVVIVSVAAHVISARQAAQTRHDHHSSPHEPFSSLHEPLLHSRSGTQTTDIAEARSDREMLMTAAESIQSSVLSSSGSAGARAS
jgi:hypothetical protein